MASDHRDDGGPEPGAGRLPLRRVGLNRLLGELRLQLGRVCEGRFRLRPPEGLTYCTQGGNTRCEVPNLDNVVFVLPSGYRPAERSLFASTSYSSDYDPAEIPARVDVRPDGAVVVVAGHPTAWITLEGVTFQATH
jgi:hypothetical protein